MKKNLTLIAFLTMFCAMASSLLAQPLAFYYGTPGITERGMKIAVGPDGSFFLAGDRASFVDTTGIEPTNRDIELVKTDANGQVIWHIIIDSTLTDAVFSVLAETDGGATLLASSCENVLAGIGCNQNNVRIYRLDADGVVQWVKDYYTGSNEIPSGFVHSPDGGYVISGITAKYNATGDLFLLHLDANGEEVWEAIVAATGARSFDVVQAAGGGYYTSGSSIEANGRTVVVAKVDEQGTVLWTQYYGKGSFNGRMATMPDGFALLLTITSSDFLPTDLYLLDVDGNIVWEKDLNGQLRRPTGLALTQDGLTLTGLDESANPNNKVAQVVKYDFDGTLQWSKKHDPFPDFYEHPSDIITLDSGYAITGFTELKDSIAWVFPEDLMLLVLDKNGDIDSAEIIINGTVDSQQNVAVQVFPNPFSETINFKLDEAFEALGLTILNGLGQICYSGEFSGNAVQIGTQNWTKGLYYYEIRTPDKRLLCAGKLFSN